MEWFVVEFKDVLFDDCFMLIGVFVFVDVFVVLCYCLFVMYDVMIYLVDVECCKVCFLSWYEMFLCLVSDDLYWYGMFDDVIVYLLCICDMGFDVLYFLLIYLIGMFVCKGCNNSLIVGFDDVGSLYVIGLFDGGYMVVYLQFGMFELFCVLVDVVCGYGFEIVFDFVIQCLFDYLWFVVYLGWFVWWLDGLLCFVENLLKCYQDIVNFDFYVLDVLFGLWFVLCDVVLFWVDVGVWIFCVDNLYMKLLLFWVWMIVDVCGWYLDVVFLFEVFMWLVMMYCFVKVGFLQLYMYFMWCELKCDFIDYLIELMVGLLCEFFWLNFFVNMFDINLCYLQNVLCLQFVICVVFVVMLVGLWGLYLGFEFGELVLLLDSEEYVDVEKYELCVCDWSKVVYIGVEIVWLNCVWCDYLVLQMYFGFMFVEVDNDLVFVFMKVMFVFDSVVVVVISFDLWYLQVVNFMFDVVLWCGFGLVDGELFDVFEQDVVYVEIWCGYCQYVLFDLYVWLYVIWWFVLFLGVVWVVVFELDFVCGFLGVYV